MNDTAKPDRPRETAELISDLWSFDFYEHATRLTELEAERDRLEADNQRMATEIVSDYFTPLQRRLEAAEAERDRLEESYELAAVNYRTLLKKAEAAEEAGRQKATAEIVAWLNEQPAITNDPLRYAEAIRRGDHLTTGDRK